MVKSNILLVIITLFLLTISTDTALAASTDFTVSQTIFSTAVTAPAVTDLYGGYVDYSRGKLLQYLQIFPSQNNVLIAWQTSIPTGYILRWGRDTDYSKASSISDELKGYHSALISNLKSDTLYFYELVAYDKNGETYTLSSGKFNTLAQPDLAPPANIINLKATLTNDNQDVLLSWDNPLDTDFSHIRIVRNPLFYPVDPSDGYILYEGDGEDFLDKDTFTLDNAQYYTVFTYDHNGNVSSGAVIYVSKSGLPPVVQVSTSTEAFVFDISDIYLTQDGNLISTIDGVVSVDGGKPITIGIPYDALPEHLKTIVVTFTHPSDDSLKFSFLLRVNKDKTAYIANLEPFYEAGKFKMTVSIFDYQTKLLEDVDVYINTHYTPKERGSLVQVFIQVFEFLLVTRWSLILLIILLLLPARRILRRIS